jgi:hypothetical protein
MIHPLHTACPTHLILFRTSPCHVQSASSHHLYNEDSSWFPPSVRTVHDTCLVRSAEHTVCQQDLVGCPALCALSCCLASGSSTADQHSQVQEGASSLWLHTKQQSYWTINRLHTQLNPLEMFLENFNKSGLLSGTHLKRGHSEILHSFVISYRKWHSPYLNILFKFCIKQFTFMVKPHLKSHIL